MGRMKNSDNDSVDTAALSIECSTCVAIGTTACTDCLVTHLIANDDGPIEYLPVPVGRPRTVNDRAIELFAQAGLLDDPVRFATLAEFEVGAGASVSV